MAKRAHALCQHLVDHYDGDASRIWRRVKDPEVVYDRIRALPGYGEEKSKIFLAILGKRLGQAAPGWEEAAAPFSDATPRSVADVDSPESMAQARAVKREMKEAKGAPAKSMISRGAKGAR